jgi:hypothetical protein
MSEPSPDVRRFVAESIESAEQLEILLLLQREPERQWAVGEVSQAVYTVPASAIMRLEALVAGGFASTTGGSDPRYQFEPRTEELRRQVDALAAAYAKDRVALIKLIFAKPPDPLQSFADAFRFRKDT